MNYAKNDFLEECYFKTSRSGGKGGQHVNKTESKVSLFFNVRNSNLLNDRERNILLNKLNLSKEGVLQIDSEATRSQLKNKKNCIEKFYKLLEESLAEKKDRKVTKPTKAAIRKRLKEKKRRSELKQNRTFNY